MSPVRMRRLPGALRARSATIAGLSRNFRPDCDAAVDQRHPVEMEIQTCFRVVAVGERVETGEISLNAVFGHRIAIEHHRAEVEASGCSRLPARDRWPPA